MWYIMSSPTFITGTDGFLQTRVPLLFFEDVAFFCSSDCVPFSFTFDHLMQKHLHVNQITPNNTLGRQIIS